jgi:hypothetical protein
MAGVLLFHDDNHQPMETPSTLFNSAKDRLANPFLFSFLASWMLYNWRIPLSLFWYSDADIWKEGYQSLFDLVGQSIHK